MLSSECKESNSSSLSFSSNFEDKPWPYAFNNCYIDNEIKRFESNVRSHASYYTNPRPFTKVVTIYGKNLRFTFILEFMLCSGCAKGCAARITVLAISMVILYTINVAC